MNTLAANVYNELDKMFHKKKTLALLALTTLVPTVTAILFAFFQNRAGVSGIGSSGFPVMILGLFTNLFLPLFIFMWMADSFAGEAGEKTLKLLIVRPISRMKVFTSKIISTGLATGIFLLILFVLSSLAGLFLGLAGNGWWNGLLNDFKAYALALFPMLGLGIVAAFVAQFFRNSSGALTTSIFIYIAAKLLAFLVPQSSKLSLVSYTNWHLLWLGQIPAATLLYASLFILSYGIIFFSAGLYAFVSREL